MITDYSKYNLITETEYYYENDNLPKDILKIGTEVKYINNAMDLIRLDYRDMLASEQKNYVKNNIKKIQKITGKFYGEQWWSKFGDPADEDDNSWVPDKYIEPAKKLPSYKPKKMIYETMIIKYKDFINEGFNHRMFGLQDVDQLYKINGFDDETSKVMKRLVIRRFKNGGDQEVIDFLRTSLGVEIFNVSKGRYSFEPYS